MSFRVRLSVFLLAILFLVQGLTWALVYHATRRASIDEGERQLVRAANTFVTQMDNVSTRIAGSVQVLSLDYPLRAAIAQRDAQTIWSALRNHGRRVGAERMLLLDLEGQVRIDTAHPPGTGEAHTPAFLPPGMLRQVYKKPVVAVVAIEQRAYWLVVVPVYAPQPIALIAAGIPIDSALLQRLAALPKSVELVASERHGPWHRVARGDPSLDIIGALQRQHLDLPREPRLMRLHGHEYVVLARSLMQSTGGMSVAALFGYSLDDALDPFRSMTSTWAALVALGLVLGAIGAWLLARGVARPLETLTEASVRIRAGDYSIAVDKALARRNDEFGRLGQAFLQMSEAISEREQRVRHQADHDALSGLFNRPAAQRRIQAMLDHPRHDRPAALLMIGLSRLDDIVNTLGHASADRMLQAAAARLHQAADGALIARAGDDRLLLWLDNCSGDQAMARASALCERLNQPLQDGQLRLDPGAIVGVSLWPEHGNDAGLLIQRSEVALYQAARIEQPVTLYDQAIDPNRPEHLELMSELNKALDGNDLVLHYQPKLALARSQISAAEGLLRWPHPIRGNIPPDRFIPLAEKTGHVRRLTRWVLTAGIAEARRWQQAGHNCRLSLNLSARDIEDRELPRRVRELLAAHHLGGEALSLEVTESAAMRQPERAIEVMRELVDLGIDIAIDDFGVGHSSLAYLRRLPARELKIDQSFVRGLADNADDRTIVRSIIELGHRLGFSVTAEGVEDRQALDFLAAAGCDMGQGYFIGRPMPPSAFAALLAGANERSRDDG